MNEYEKLKSVLFDKFHVRGSLAEYAFEKSWNDQKENGADAIEAEFKSLMPLFVTSETGDTGHDALMKDITDLYAEAHNYEFHDFKNTTHATPKVVLAQKFEGLRQNVLDGKYDN